jgi:hypothetical protein
MSCYGKRAKRTIDLLTQGAEFVCRIERDPSTDLNQLKCRIMFDGRIIQGFGLGTFNELRDAGYLTIVNCETSVGSYYKLNPESTIRPAGAMRTGPVNK